MINFLHVFKPSPILISLGPINVYWYGLLIVSGILLGTLITLRLSKYYNLKKETIINLIFWLLISGLLGARIYHVLLEWPYYLKHPFNILAIWQGGLAIHGAIITGLAIVWIFTKKNKLNFWLLAAVLVPGLMLAQAIGRWGNYFNQELFGQPTNLSWGIPIDFTNRPLAYISSEFFHPAFLYESLGNLLIFLILISFHVWIIKKHKFSNLCYLLLVVIYLILYSLLRFILEFIRIDPTYVILGLRFPQIISLIIIFLSFLLLLLKIKKHATIQ